MYVFISCAEDGSFEFICSDDGMSKDMICDLFEDAIEAIYGGDENLEELDFNDT